MSCVFVYLDKPEKVDVANCARKDQVGTNSENTLQPTYPNSDSENESEYLFDYKENICDFIFR